MITALSALSVVASLQASQSLISSFLELKQAIDFGDTVISISTAEIVFQQQLYVLDGVTVAIEGGAKSRTILSGDNSSRLFVVDDRSSLSLRGVTLDRGRCSGCSGGAVFVGPGSELWLHSVLVSGNNAQIGGAIFALSSSVLATSCTITANSASSGGAIFAEGDSTVKATSSTITANSAGYGGAVRVGKNANFTMINCVMHSNTAGATGGAVAARDDSTVVIAGSRIFSNQAELGGAIFMDARATVVLADCAMLSNVATSIGGVVYCIHEATINATNCLFASNSAYDGGGMLYAGGSASVFTTNCTAASNTGYWGGGLYAQGESSAHNAFHPRGLGRYPATLSRSLRLISSRLFSSRQTARPSRWRIVPSHKTPDIGVVLSLPTTARWWMRLTAR
jgi:predicted outer membrane repeat protein